MQNLSNDSSIDVDTIRQMIQSGLITYSYFYIASKKHTNQLKYSRNYVLLQTRQNRD